MLIPLGVPGISGGVPDGVLLAEVNNMKIELSTFFLPGIRLPAFIHVAVLVGPEVLAHAPKAAVLDVGTAHLSGAITLVGIRVPLNFSHIIPSISYASQLILAGFRIPSAVVLDLLLVLFRHYVVDHLRDEH